MTDNDNILQAGDLAFLYLLLNNGDLADLEEVTADRLASILWRLLRNATPGDPEAGNKDAGDQILDLIGNNVDGVPTKAVLIGEFLDEEDGEEHLFLVKSPGISIWDTMGLMEFGKESFMRSYRQRVEDED